MSAPITLADVRRALEELIDELDGPVRAQALVVLGLLTTVQQERSDR